MNAISWTYVILAEAVNPEHGLGYMVELARTHQKASWSFAGLLVIGGIGLLTDFIIRTDLADPLPLAGGRHERELTKAGTPRRPRRRPASRAPSPSTSAPAAEKKPSYRADLTGAPPKLRVKDLSVTYINRDGDGTEAVRDVSFDVEDKPDVGEVVVFLGPSGCGKSTILKAVAGLLPPTKGEILMDGKPVDGVGRDRGMVFQAYTSFGWLTVRDNVEYGLKLQGVPASERRERSEKYLKSVGLSDFADRYPKDLSGGMKQRVAIARTLINRPRVILMDEPFGALDPQTRWGMQGLLLDVSRSEDPTILFVTHDVSEAVYLADTVYVLSARPARLLHRVDVPYFPVRNIELKSAPEFRAVEKKLLDLLYASAIGRILGRPWAPSRRRRRPRRPRRGAAPKTAAPRRPRSQEGISDAARSVARGARPRPEPLPEDGLHEPLQPLALRRRAGGGGPHAEPRAGDRGARPRRRCGFSTRRTASASATSSGTRGSRSSGRPSRRRSAPSGSPRWARPSASAWTRSWPGRSRSGASPRRTRPSRATS